MHLMDTLIKIINIHVITGRFSPAILHHAPWYPNYTPQGHYQIPKFHSLLSSRTGEYGIPNGKNGGGGHHYVSSYTFPVKANTPCSMVSKGFKFIKENELIHLLQLTRSPALARKITGRESLF